MPSQSKGYTTVTIGWCVWISKSFRYESPYSVTGTVKRTGSQWGPKGNNAQIELLERGKQPMWRSIATDETVTAKNNKRLNGCESGGINSMICSFTVRNQKNKSK